MDKETLLRKIIQYRLLANSACGLAKEVGASKTSCNRFDRGEAGPGAINEIWQSIIQTYHTTDEEIAQYIEAYEQGIYIWKEVKASADALQTDLHTLADTILDGLLLVDGARVCKVLHTRYWNSLLELNQQHPFDYARMVAIYFAASHGLLEHLTKKDKKHVACRKTIKLLVDHIQAVYPENAAIGDMATALVEELVLINEGCSMWLNISRPANLVQSITDPSYHTSMSTIMEMLPVRNISLWMTHDDLHNFSAHAFIMYEYTPEGWAKSMYECIEVAAQISDKVYAPIRYFRFWLTNESMDENYLIGYIQFRNSEGDIQLVRYLARYDQEHQNLYLDHLDSDVPDSTTLPIPKELHYLNPDHIIIDKEKDWLTWFNEWSEANEENVFNTMLQSEGASPEMSYEITDVSISRNYLTLSLDHNGTPEVYRCHLQDYPSLRKIDPNIQVCVVRKENDNQLYFKWFYPHIMLSMTVFQKVDTE